MSDGFKFTDQQAKRIIQALQDRGANSDCPRCGKDVFNLEEGYFIQGLTPGLHRRALPPEKSIPSVVLSCMNCGFIMQYAVGVLGLWDQFQGGE